MSTSREACAQCGKRNGHIRTGKQHHRCNVCGRAFVLTPENSVVTEEQRRLIERLLWAYSRDTHLCRIRNKRFYAE